MLNCPAVVAVAPATDGAFAWVDAMSMLARFKQITQNVRWIMHPGVLPDLGASGWVTGNVSREVADLGFGPPITSEHMPQANYNDVLLADLGAYVLFVRQELTIAYSEHSAFLTDKGTWRFTERLDGQPWLKGKITLADPQGSYTVSPYVVHADA
jgi:HK97 family phage major capsid protein